MIIGTAGHIDHGKTTLVHALTGVDTDRLKEEKERGNSIELGYAYTPTLGFIDVPGHERLVHTMVAGASGIDFALLVIAADDGVMPQTREHLAILGLLGVSRGAVALTKIDRVDGVRIQDVRAEIDALLVPTSLRDAPIFPLNATAPDDPGTELLREHLEQAAAEFPVRRDQRLFRLAIDRVFTLSGHGTIVAGTVFSGQVRTGETVTIMPSGTEVRVRNIHAQNRPADIGRAGQRCALNLAGIETRAISRGEWLADSRVFVPTSQIDVRLQLLPTAGPQTPLHVHLGTAHHVAKVVPLETADRVRLVFDRPICAIPGDRFIVRDAQAIHTVGGGVVLDPFAPRKKRKFVERAPWLDALQELVAGVGLAPLLEAAPLGVKMSDLVRLTGLPPEHISLPACAVMIDASHGRFVLDPAHWEALRNRIVSTLAEFHQVIPDEPGPDVGRLRRIVTAEFPADLWRALVDTLVQDRRIIRSGPWLHLPDHVVTLSAEDQELAQKLQPLIADGRFDPPWVRDLATVSHEPEERVRSVLIKSVTRGSVYQVVHDLFYDRESIGELAAIITRLAEEHGGVEAARYRDVLGVGRKRTIQILEFFDRVGYTRRVKDTHVLRQDSGWRA